MQVHHRDIDPANNDPANLQILCRGCHSTLHFHLRRDAERQASEVMTQELRRRDDERWQSLAKTVVSMPIGDELVGALRLLAQFRYDSDDNEALGRTVTDMLCAWVPRRFIEAIQRDGFDWREKVRGEKSEDAA